MGVVWAAEREGFHEVGQSLRTGPEALKVISGALWASHQMPDSPGLHRKLQALRHLREEKGEPQTLVCTRLSKVSLRLHPSYPSGLVTAATQRRLIPGLTHKMLMHSCAHQSEAVRPISHLLIRGLQEPPLPTPASLCLTIHFYPGKSPGTHLPAPSPSWQVSFFHRKA